MKHSLSLLATTMLFAMSSAWAASNTSSSATTGDPMQKFQAMDKNGDGVLSDTEAKSDAQLQNSFKSADADGDGRISFSEFSNSGRQSGTGSSQPGMYNQPGMPDQMPGSPGQPAR